MIRRYFRTYDRRRSFYSHIDTYHITFTKITHSGDRVCYGYIDAESKSFKGEEFTPEQVLDIVFNDLGLIEITEAEHITAVGI